MVVKVRGPFKTRFPLVLVRLTHIYCYSIVGLRKKIYLEREEEDFLDGSLKLAGIFQHLCLSS